jgi:hypothetical protein
MMDKKTETGKEAQRGTQERRYERRSKSEEHYIGT